MRFCVASLVLMQVVLASAGQVYDRLTPKAKAPEQWRGVKFGLTIDSVLTIVDSLFFEAELVSNEAITANGLIDQDTMRVRFEFNSETRELWEISYICPNCSRVAVQKAFETQYGKPSTSDYGYTGPPDGISYYEYSLWIWGDIFHPNFTIRVECGRVYLNEVRYIWKDIHKWKDERESNKGRSKSSQY